MGVVTSSYHSFTPLSPNAQFDNCYYPQINRTWVLQISVCADDATVEYATFSTQKAQQQEAFDHEHMLTEYVHSHKLV